MKRSEIKRTVGLARGAVPLNRRTSLARQATPQPRQPRQDATKTTPRVNDWPDEVRALLAARSGSVCESCWAAPATDAHHRQRRRNGLHTITNAIHLCRADHAHWHQHPADAREYGFIVPTWSDPATVPVLLGGSRWALLTADGAYRTDQRGWPTP